MPETFYSNSQSVLGLAIETTRGTYQAPAFWIPATNPAISPTVTETEDKGLRGSMVDRYGLIPGNRFDTYDFTCYCYLDTLPLLLRAIMGSSDTVTGSSNPYTHKIGLANGLGAGNQPPSLTLVDYDGFTYRRLTGAQMDTLSIKFTATGVVELTCKFLCNPFTASGTAIVPAFTSVQAVPAWDCLAQQGGTTIDRIVDGTITLSRAVKAVPALIQSQAPRLLWAGPLAISGSATWLMTDDTELTAYLAGTELTWALAFTDPNNTVDSFKLQMSRLRLDQAKQTRSGDGMIQTSANLMPLPSVTDAAPSTDGGGVSPILFSVLNAVAAAY